MLILVKSSLKQVNFLGVVLLLALIPVSFLAHDGLHEQIIATSKVILKDPQNPLLYLKRAELYRLHQEWRRSEADLDRAEALDSRLVTVDLARGRLWFDEGKFHKAKIAFGKFLSKEPNSFEGILSMARVLAKSSEIILAADYYTRAIENAPNDSAELYIERANALASIGKIHSALAGLDDGLSKLGQIVTLATTAIDFELKRKNYDAAIIRLDRLTAVMPNKESFYLRRGEILLKAGKRCEARQSLLDSRGLYDRLSPARKNIRAIREQMSRVDALLIRNPPGVCR